MNKKLYMLVFFVSFVLVSTPVFSWEKTIPIPYYSVPPEEPDWSGPAAAKMILESPIIMADPLYVMQTQTDLWNYISSHNDSDWNTLDYPTVHTDPIAMRDCLREFDTRSAFTYNIHKTETYDAILSQKIIETIAIFDVPPAVPLYGGLNWVAVFAASTDIDPLGSDPYEIYWFQINDPSDTALGIGKFVFYEGAYDEVWENGPDSVFSHIPTPESFPLNLQKFAVCDPQVPGPLKVQASKPLPRRETVLTPNEAKEAAIKALKKYNIIDKPGYQYAEKRIRSGNPILVERMTRRGHAGYYIVPMVKRYFIFWKKLTGVVLIDAYSGAILEASVTKRPMCYPYLTMSLSRAKNLLIKKIKKKEGIRDRDVKVETPTLTWEPGLSVSPFFPLWKVRATIKGVTQIRYLDFNKNLRLPVEYPYPPEKKKQEQVK